MKVIKVKYNNKLKPLNSNKVKDYQTLITTIRSQFTQPTQPLKMYYKDPHGDKIYIEEQKDYQQYRAIDTAVVIYVSTQLELLNLSNIQSSKNKSNQNLGDSILSIISGNIQQQHSNQIYVAEEKQVSVAVLKQTIESSKQQQLNHSQNPPLNQDRQQMIFSKPIEKKEKDSTQTIKRICKVHKKEFTGSRWKCTNVTCFDFDVCPTCKLDDKIPPPHVNNQNHKLVEIKDQNFWSKINFTHAISKLFDPHYDKQKQMDSNEVGEWITQQDVLQNSPIFINKVWKSSQPLVDKIVNDFEHWQRNYQLSQIK